MIGALAVAFAGAGLCPLAYRALERAGRWVVALLPIGLGTWIARSAPAVASGEPVVVSHPWVPALGLDLALRLDGLSLLFCLLITGIGAVVVVQAGGYLRGERRMGAFYGYLMLFMASMLGLVLADNLLLLFLFWELTSVSSFLLIGFEHEREGARTAARQSLLVTGMGGVALLGGILLLGSGADTFDLSLLLAEGHGLQPGTLLWTVLGLVFVGAFTKSAQVPFHFWLPRAMEAPTPVSAYLHSSTMVTAGVYLLARLHPLFAGLPAWEWTLTGVGGVTALVAGVLAYRQTLLKRLLAYSTVSALGLMVLCLGVGTPLAVKAAVTFVLAHALYKSALFLSVANVSLATGAKDAEKVSAPPGTLPVTASAGLLGAAAMAGLPPTVGFIGKEVIFDGLLRAGPGGALLAGIAALVAALLVAVALLVGVRPYLFGAEPRPADGASHDVAGPDLVTQAAPLLLAALALAIGIWPGGVSRFLVEPATLAVTRTASVAGLKPWYGFNPAFFLDAAAVTLGALAFAFRARGRRVLEPLDRLRTWGPEAGYHRALEALTSGARLQTRWLQSGSLHHYVIVIVATVVLAAGLALVTGPSGALPRLPWGGVRLQEAVVAVVIGTAAVVALRLDSRLAVLAVLGVLGYGIALIFVFFGAPDLATTQILVETLTVILLALAFQHLPRFPIRRRTPWQNLDALAAAAAGTVMALLVLRVAGSRLPGEVSRYFAAESVPSGRGRNIVNVILVDFRALDTLGEVVVVALGALGVFALFKLGRGGT